MHVVRLPGDLPRERGALTREPLAGVRAITFDFGNTLIPVTRAALRGVVTETARAVSGRLGPFDHGAFTDTWAEERDRQFREEVPQFREVDLAERFVRVLARLRGMAPPAPDQPWDQTSAARLVEPGEIEWAVDVYSASFVAAIPPPETVRPLLERLAAERTLGIVSNWPLASTVDRYAEAAGWRPFLRAIVVSQRVGTIKPHPAIFAAALDALGGPEPSAVLHVGDDWIADVVGAKRAGWRAAFLDARPGDSPLPSSVRDGSVVADVELTTLDGLLGLVPGGLADQGGWPRR